MTRDLYAKLAERRDLLNIEWEKAWLALRQTPEYQAALSVRADLQQAALDEIAARDKLPKLVRSQIDNEKTARISIHSRIECEACP